MGQYRVTGTWGSGGTYVSVGDELSRPDSGERLTACVGDGVDPSGVTGTYFLERSDPPLAPIDLKGPGGWYAVPVWAPQ